MHLYDLPTAIPWLSLIWLSMLVPAIIMMFLKPEQKQTIRMVGTVFAFISLALSLLVFFAYVGIHFTKWKYNQPDFESFRFSAGVGVAWNSPIGPLKFSYAVPLQSKPGDRLQRFQFQVGTVF